MPTGINASIVNLLNGTIANAPDVLSSLNSLNSSGISNDNGAISTSGGGVMTLPSVNVTTNLGLILGTIARIGRFSGTGNALITHNWGVVPDFVIVSFAGNFGGPPTQVPAWYNATNTQVNIVAQSGFFWYALLIGF